MLSVESHRHFMNKKREYQKDKLMSLQQTVKTGTLETCTDE
jgi:hypothetical protein